MDDDGRTPAFGSGELNWNAGKVGLCFGLDFKSRGGGGGGLLLHHGGRRPH